MKFKDIKNACSSIPLIPTVQQKLDDIQVFISTPVDGDLLPPYWTIDDRFKVRQLYYDKETLISRTLLDNDFKKRQTEFYTNLAELVLSRYKNVYHKRYELYEILYDLLPFKKDGIFNAADFCVILFNNQKDFVRFKTLKHVYVNIDNYRKMGYVFKLLKQNGVKPDEIHKNIKSFNIIRNFDLFRFDNVEKELIGMLLDYMKFVKQKRTKAIEQPPKKDNNVGKIVLTMEELTKIVKEAVKNHVSRLRTSIIALENAPDITIKTIIKDVLSNQGGKNV